MVCDEKKNFVERQLGSHVVVVLLKIFCQYRDCDETMLLMDVQCVWRLKGELFYMSIRK